MPVVSAPCSCQPDCLVCGRGEVPPHDCAIHVLLELMVFQERMLHSEPTEARLEKILQSGKEYLPRAKHMMDKIVYVGRQCITMSKVAFHDTMEILHRDKLFSTVK
ncbi:uncharacterized protein TNCV_3871451 [Trichonephila clavipes]|nr:uncharacterized protein TNCV_3871451 [Trichonephila clavipes]